MQNLCFMLYKNTQISFPKSEKHFALARLLR